MNTKHITPLIAILALSAFSNAAIETPDQEVKEPAYVVAEDGLVVMYASSPINSANNFFVHFEGVAKSSDGTELAMSEKQAEEIKAKLEERLSQMKISDFKDQSIKDDMRTVFEEDLKIILRLDADPKIQVTQLLISSSNQRDKKKK